VKYRAVLIEVDATRETKPQQCFGPTIEPLEIWAKARLQQATDGSYVAIFEIIEKPVRHFTKTSDLAGQAVLVEPA
jgi:hypothetical protein